MEYNNTNRTTTTTKTNQIDSSDTLQLTDTSDGERAKSHRATKRRVDHGLGQRSQR
jgi:hypothetical protein